LMPSSMNLRTLSSTNGSKATLRFSITPPCRTWRLRFNPLDQRPVKLDQRRPLLHRRLRSISPPRAILIEIWKPGRIHLPAPWVVGDTSATSPTTAIETRMSASLLHPDRRSAPVRAPHAASSIRIGVWSEALSRPRIALSMSTDASRSAACGERSKWSMRMPLFFCQAPA
jgi:hypothetical protein